MSAWCFLGLHRWISMERPVTRRGIRYIATYNRCDRPGCRRYPQWICMDMRRIG